MKQSNRRGRTGLCPGGAPERQHPKQLMECECYRDLLMYKGINAVNERVVEE